MQEETPATGQTHVHHDTTEHQGMEQGSMHQTARGDGKSDDTGEMDHGGMCHGGMPHMESRATGPQKFVVGLASVLALVVALIFSATYANLSISAPEVEGAVMPPGMIMTYDLPAEAMRDMAYVAATRRG